MKRILCSMLVATLPFGGVLAQAPKEKNTKVTLVCQHELPNAPGGQSFSEMPGDRHGVGANASETEPARLLAVFVVDTSEKELTFPLEK
jgi:hypothetical protein